MITPSDFAVFVTTVNTMIGEAYSSAAPASPEFVTPVSTGEGSIFEDGWTGRMPKARVWAGPRVVHEPGPQTYKVPFLPFELTATVDRFRLDDDMKGIYYRVLPDLALQMSLLQDQQVRDLIENTGYYKNNSFQTGLDALNFFSTAHPVDFYDTSKGTYINDFSAGGQTVTYKDAAGATKTRLVGGALTNVAIFSLLEYMRQLKAEDGEVLGITPTHIMVAPFLSGELEWLLASMFMGPPAWGVIGSQVGASDNPLRRFGLKPLVNERLTLQGTWYMMDNSKSVKAMRFGWREQPRLVPRTNENDPIVFSEHRYEWGYWARAIPLWSFPWLMCRSSE